MVDNERFLCRKKLLEKKGFHKNYKIFVRKDFIESESFASGKCLWRKLRVFCVNERLAIVVQKRNIVMENGKFCRAWTIVQDVF